METTLVKQKVDIKNWQEFAGKIPSSSQREEQERYHKYFGHSPVPFVLIGSEGIVYLNDSLRTFNPVKERALLDALMEPIHKTSERKAVSTFDLAEGKVNSYCKKFDYCVGGSTYQLRISRIKGLVQESYVQVAVTDVTKDRQLELLKAENCLLIKQGEAQQKTIQELEEERDKKAQEEEVLGVVRALLNHDAKSPLTSIKGYAQLLHMIISKLPEANRDERIIRGLEIIDQSVTRASKRLIEAISISNKPVPEDIVVDNFLETVIAENAGLVNPKHEEIRVLAESSSSKGEQHFWSDKTWILPIINTIILNGRDAGATEISLRCEQISDECVFYMTDNGSGMEQDIMNKLNSDKYERTDSKKGNGIGFKNAKKMMEMLGGRLWVEHSKVGQGSIIAVAFPVSSYK